MLLTPAEWGNTYNGQVTTENMEFSVVQGDIAEQSADALVSAAETSLDMENGVAAALRRGAEGSIEAEAASKGPIGLGGVAVTDAYTLDAEYVIHAAAMPQFGSGQASAASIRAATKNALRQADALECESIVLPILGTGAANFGFKEGGHIICTVVDNYEPSSLSDVRLIAHTELQEDLLRRIAAAVEAA